MPGNFDARAEARRTLIILKFSPNFLNNEYSRIFGEKVRRNSRNFRNYGMSSRLDGSKLISGPLLPSESSYFDIFISPYSLSVLVR